MKKPIQPQPPNYKELYETLYKAQVEAIGVMLNASVETEIKVIKPYEKWERTGKMKIREKDSE